MFAQLLSMLRFSLSYTEGNKVTNIIRQNEKMVKKDKSNQYLTLEDICPTWSKRLKLGLDKKYKDIMAHDSKYCLVGEAWGFTGKHAGYYLAPLIPFVGCWTCVQYGNNMGRLVRKATDLQSRDLEPIITEFLKHWNGKHKSITEKLEKRKRF